MRKNKDGNSVSDYGQQMPYQDPRQPVAALPISTQSITTRRPIQLNRALRIQRLSNILSRRIGSKLRCHINLAEEIDSVNARSMCKNYVICTFILSNSRCMYIVPTRTTAFDDVAINATNASCIVCREHMIFSVSHIHKFIHSCCTGTHFLSALVAPICAKFVPSVVLMVSFVRFENLPFVSILSVHMYVYCFGGLL